jgi:epoxyqueuosine reductase
VTAEPDAREVIDECLRLGFARAGIARVDPSEHADEYRAWISRGRHGEMAYLARHVETRLDPARLLEGAHAAIMVADLYALRGGADPALPPGRGRIARYARGRDYHVTMKRRLHALSDRLRHRSPAHRFRAFVDTAPVLERELAQRAGLGWIGKHTLLIEPRLGSYLLLGGVLTTLPLAPAISRVQDHCGTCTRCIDACPTSAITPYSVDATRCISYLTIEHRGQIDPSLRPKMGSWAFGCDVCQEVCPHNSPRAPRPDAPHPDHAPFADADGSKRDSLDLLRVLGWTEDDRRAAFARSALRRATLDMIRRNASIALDNSRAQTSPRA